MRIYNHVRQFYTSILDQLIILTSTLFDRCGSCPDVTLQINNLLVWISDVGEQFSIFFPHFLLPPEQAPSDTKLPIRRERTYEDVGDFVTKVEIEEGDDGKMSGVIIRIFGAFLLITERFPENY